MDFSTSNRRNLTSANFPQLKPDICIKPFHFKKIRPDTVSGPSPRSGHRVVCNDRFLFSYGGYDRPPGVLSTGRIFNELWSYRIQTGTWKKLNCRNPPPVAASCAVALINDTLYVLGGTATPFGEYNSGELYACNLAERRLTFRLVETSGDSPEQLYGQTIKVIGNSLFCFGGTTGSTFKNDVHALDLDTRKWVLCSAQSHPRHTPEPRYRAEMAVYEDELYVFGGGTKDSAFPLDKVHAFNVKTWTWRTVHAYSGCYPNARKAHSLVQVPGAEHRVIISGGTGPEGPCDDTWLFDIKKLTFEILPWCTFDYGLWFHDSVVTSYGKMVTFGGVQKRKGCEQRTNEVSVAWARLPALSELALEVLTEAFPVVKTCSYDCLRGQLGIPIQFVERIVDGVN